MTLHSYRFFLEMPDEETNLLHVGQYLNDSEVKEVGQRQFSGCSPGWKEGEGI